ncbi:hypothetical protein ACRALDRAFT_2095583 [Sodiomyces alcalophilus JCM 7366]|uniref:uncharacterized protein n=1 Tax=Sodiomyces alcalophilus JCM 7366 TaxID=591952 RepID=UPI0039B53F9D
MTGRSPFPEPPIETRQNPPITPSLTTTAQPLNSSQYGLPASSLFPLSEPKLGLRTERTFTIRSSSGKATTVRQRKPASNASYESMIAARTKTKEGRAKRGYYGIDINDLIDVANKEFTDRRTRRIDVPERAVRPSVETGRTTPAKDRNSLLWTEKYRAKTFMDLCGDDGTNRMVLRWLKRWDPLVFPGAAKKPPTVRRFGTKERAEEEKPHRKILMLTGPPGLGKTTLAHVCARQAGYEVMEINASDERSRDVVKNRIRTSLGTESVKTVENVKSHEGERCKQKVARPACVVVDEVDGVVSGSGSSGEGGFVKALMDLVLLDQKNSAGAGAGSGPSMSTTNRKKKKSDDFRLMRPLILICNDVYNPSLKPLRQSSLAEVIHVGKPGIEAVVPRLEAIFHKEGIPCEKDAARKICEAAWGMTNSMEAKRGAHSGAEGDLRGVLVVGEWVAGRYRATAPSGTPLTRQWLDKHVMPGLASGAGGARGLGRGNVKDITDRIFQDGAGFPKLGLHNPKRVEAQHEQPRAQLGFAEHHKKHAMERLQQMIDTSGEIDRIVTDVMLEYPNREFNDDSFLTKPNTAYDWVHFYDVCSSRLYSSQEWELAPYLSQSLLACHHLFASPRRHVAILGYDKKWGGEVDKEAHVQPFSGPRADFEAREAEKRNRAVLQSIQAQLGPNLMRSFRSPGDIATGFLPYLVRLVSPDVKPVMIGGSGEQNGVASVRREAEKIIVKRAAEVLADMGITLQKGKIDDDSLFSRGPQWVYRMEPDLDALAMFATASNLHSSQAPTRYAVRQVLEQELHATIARREKEARQARIKGSQPLSQEGRTVPDGDSDKKNPPKREEIKAALPTGFKRDFFGRVVDARPVQGVDPNCAERKTKTDIGKRKVWVTYHEGLNNAVRKPISLQDLMKGM